MSDEHLEKWAIRNAYQTLDFIQMLLRHGNLIAVTLRDKEFTPFILQRTKEDLERCFPELFEKEGDS